MEKKSKAKAEMLKELSKEMSNDMYSPMKDMIGKKGMKKVSVMSDSPEGLKKGLSMAEKIMQAKSSQEGSDEEGEEEESCPKCKGKGCPFCQASEESEDSEEESPEMEAEEDASKMSPDEMEAMYEMLKKKLGK
jgi:hypothetical protein